MNSNILGKGIWNEKWGGEMVLKSPTLIYLEWIPWVQDKEWVSSERIWILVHQNESNIAICSVYIHTYMAAEIMANDDYKSWNESLYETIQGELRRLENDGYKCIIMRDMNDILVHHHLELMETNLE